MDIQLAHFGTSGGFSEKTKTIVDAFLDHLKNGPRKHRKHRISFDISAVALDKDSEGVSKLTEEEFRELAVYARKIGPKRIAFGTDYPLYTTTEYEKILREKVGLTEDEMNSLRIVKSAK